MSDKEVCLSYDPADARRMVRIQGPCVKFAMEKNSRCYAARASRSPITGSVSVKFVTEAREGEAGGVLRLRGGGGDAQKRSRSAGDSSDGSEESFRSNPKIGTGRRGRGRSGSDTRPAWEELGSELDADLSEELSTYEELLRDVQASLMKALAHGGSAATIAAIRTKRKEIREKMRGVREQQRVRDASADFSLTQFEAEARAAEATKEREAPTAPVPQREAAPCACGKTEEVAQLVLANTRLQGEMRELRAELAALKQSRRAEAAPVPPPQAQSEVGALSELRALFLSSLGALNARLDGLEARGSAVPERTRPPLTARGSEREFPPLPTPSTRRAPPLVPPPRRPVGRAPAPAGEEPWTAVTRRRRRRAGAAPVASSGGAPPATGGTPLPQRAAPAARREPTRRRLKPPRSTAVSVKLTAEAVESGVTYAAVIQRAKAAINLADVGITSGLTTRISMSGARLLQIPGANSGDVADRLAARLREVVADVATIARPERCADMRISGLDDTVTAEDVAQAVAAKGGCPPDRVGVGALRPGPGGTTSVLVRCPVRAAQVIVAARRLLVGWLWVPVMLLDSRPMRCFKCMGVGHTRAFCPSEVDRSLVCFRCGLPGHKAAECSAVPRCAVCADRGAPAGHIMGSRACVPPRRRVRDSSPARTTAQNAPRRTTEEVEMLEADASLSDQPSPSSNPNASPLRGTGRVLGSERGDAPEVETDEGSDSPIRPSQARRQSVESEVYDLD